MTQNTPSTDNESALYQTTLMSKFNAITENCKKFMAFDDKMIHRLKESDFRQHLLPIVQSWIRGKVDVNTNVWIQLAGSPTRQIYVVDDRTGEELFVVPPPYADIPMIAQEPEVQGRPVTGGALAFKQNAARDNKEDREYMRLEEQIMQFFKPQDATAVKTQHLLSLLIIWTRYKLDVKELLGEHADEVMALLTKGEIDGDGAGTATRVVEDSPEDNEPLRF